MAALLCGLGLGCASLPKAKLKNADAPSVQLIDLGIANVFLVSGARHILIDSGSDGSQEELFEALDELGVKPASLAAVVLTHGHADHAGGAAALQRRYRVPIIAAKGDEPMLSKGKNRPLKPIGFLAHVIRPFVDDPYKPLTADLVIEQPLDLAPYGVQGYAIPAPGHTPGALVVRLADGRTFAGDALRSHVLFSSCPETHFFHDDAEAALAQIATWLPGATTIFVGHGGPLDAKDVRQWFKAQRSAD